MSCCKNNLDDVFNADFARKELKSYKKRGLSRRGRKVLAAIESTTDLNNKTALEIGAGAGALTVELLRRGVAGAVAVDAVPAMIGAAQQLATELGLSDRLELVTADFAENASAIQPADIVVLDRVVCCYPNWASLLSAAAVRTRRTLVMTYPRDTWFWRTEARVFNAVMGIFRRDFRFHVHPANEMKKLLNTYNLTPTVAGHHVMWEILVAVHR